MTDFIDFTVLINNRYIAVVETGVEPNLHSLTCNGATHQMSKDQFLVYYSLNNTPM